MRTLDNPNRSLAVDGSYGKITFLVVSYKRPERLRLCLESIARQVYMDYDIVVSDDGTPTDETKVLAEAFNAKFVKGERLVIDGIQRRNLPGVINRAYPYIEGDIIQVLQRDHIIAPDFGLWLARTFSPNYAMIGLTDTTDVAFTTDDLNAMVRTLHIPEREMRFMRAMYSGRAVLREILDWREMDGMDLAFHRNSFVGIDPELWGTGHFWLDFLLRLRLSGILFMLNPMMKLWNFTDTPPTDEDWQGEYDRSYKYMTEKWPDIWNTMPVDYIQTRQTVSLMRTALGIN